MSVLPSQLEEENKVGTDRYHLLSTHSSQGLIHAFSMYSYALFDRRETEADRLGRGKWAYTWLVSGKGESQTLIVILWIPHPKPQDHNITLINKWRGKCKSQICNFALCICSVGKLKGNGKQLIRSSNWWRWSEIATAYYTVQEKPMWRGKKSCQEEMQNQRREFWDLQSQELCFSSGCKARDLLVAPRC